MLGIFSQNLDLPFRLTIQLMKKYSDTMLDYFYDSESEEKNVVQGTSDIVTRFILGGTDK